MSRVLLLPYAPTTGLAHVGACLAVGAELRERGHEVVFGYGGRAPEVIEAEGFEWRPVREVSPEREWDPRGRFDSTAEILDLVRDNLRLIDEVRPDAALTSSGGASLLACEAAGLPEVHLMHYLPIQPYGRRATIASDRLRDLRHPHRAARIARGRVRRLRARRGSTDHDRMREARRELGLPTNRGPTGDASGRLRVAVTSAPFLEPARDLPDHWRYVGPLTWSAPAEQPPPRRGERPLVYVTQGSTGSAEMLRRAVASLAGEDVDVLAATGGLCEAAELERLGANVTARRLLPGRACIEAADVAVVHGGHLTACEALRAGTPVAILPLRGDQIVRVHQVERLGVGIGLSPPPREAGIRRAVRRLLRRQRYRRRATALAGRLHDWDGQRAAARAVEEQLAATS